MEGILFWVCGVGMVLGGLMTVTQRNAVVSAVWLIFAFVCAAGIFALLSAPFLAVMQILVYAGAIMVLFLFVIMMLQGPRLEGERKLLAITLWPAVALPPLAILVMVIGYLQKDGLKAMGGPAPAGFGSPTHVAELLLGKYLLAFELISIVLLVAIIGALAVGKDEKEAAVEITLTHYLLLAMVVFLTGMTGFIVRRNAIVMLMCVELMLSAVNIVFAAFSRFHLNADGHVFVLMNFAVAAAEAAIGLAILVEIFRRRRTVNVDDLKALME